jgi:hypothetical protein
MTWWVASESGRPIDRRPTPSRPTIEVPEPPHHAYRPDGFTTACGIPLESVWTTWDATWPLLVARRGDRCATCRSMADS